MSVSGNLPPRVGGGPRVDEVDEDGGESLGVPVCTSAPRVEEPDDQGTVVVRKGPGPAGTAAEKLSTADYVARNRLILLAKMWPEINERIVDETNRLLAAGMSFSEVHCAVKEMVQEAEPGIRAERAEKVELLRRGVLSPDDVHDGAMRDLAAEKRRTDAMRAETETMRAETEALRAETGAAEVKAGMRSKKKAPNPGEKPGGKKCNPA
jgi:hypothetical protein